MVSTVALALAIVNLKASSSVTSPSRRLAGQRTAAAAGGASRLPASPAARGRGERHGPWACWASWARQTVLERPLPGVDDVIGRQAMDEDGLPVLGLRQGGIGGKPHRRGSTGKDGIVMGETSASRVPGVIVHGGIHTVGTARRGATVDADGRSVHQGVEADALDAIGEGSPVHEALLEGQGPKHHAGKTLGRL